MSRDASGATPTLGVTRWTAVWSGASLGTAAVWWLVLPLAAPLTGAAGWAGPFGELLARVCAAVLLPSSGWLWVVTTTTVTDLLRGRVRPGGPARRLVLLACGAALAAGAAAPAAAQPGGSGADTTSVLAGLSLPDRAVAAAAPSRGTRLTAGGRARTHPEHVVVRPGDSLWSIAEMHPGAGRSVDQRWRDIWAANGHVIGDDPALILPGQRLRLPATADPTHDDRSTR